MFQCEYGPENTQFQAAGLQKPDNKFILSATQSLVLWKPFGKLIPCAIVHSVISQSFYTFFYKNVSIVPILISNFQLLPYSLIFLVSLGVCRFVLCKDSTISFNNFLYCFSIVLFIYLHCSLHFLLLVLLYVCALMLSCFDRI